MVYINEHAWACTIHVLISYRFKCYLYIDATLNAAIHHIYNITPNYTKPTTYKPTKRQPCPPTNRTPPSSAATPNTSRAPQRYIFPLNPFPLRHPHTTNTSHSERRRRSHRLLRLEPIRLRRQASGRRRHESRFCQPRSAERWVWQGGGDCGEGGGV